MEENTPIPPPAPQEAEAPPKPGRLARWLDKFATGRAAAPVLGAVAFTESVILPVPPDPILIAVGLMQRERVFRLAWLCTIASVAGGFLGYLIGVFAFERLGRTILDFYLADEAFEAAKALYDDYGGWVVLIGAFTPIPYKAFTFLSGVFTLNPFVFLVASLIGRGARFYIVAGLVYYLGPKTHELFAYYQEHRYIFLAATSAVCILIIILWHIFR